MPLALYKSKLHQSTGRVVNEDKQGAGITPVLEPTMISAPDDSFRLPLRDGLEVRAPNSTSALPSLEQLRFHQRQVFKGPESAVDP